MVGLPLLSVIRTENQEIQAKYTAFCNFTLYVNIWLIKEEIVITSFVASAKFDQLSIEETSGTWQMRQFMCKWQVKETHFFQVVQALSHAHHVASAINFVFFEDIKHFWLGFTMVVYEKIYLEAHKNNQYICLKNDTAQLYFIRESWGTFDFFQFIWACPWYSQISNSAHG